MPSSSVYRERFGGLVRAYSLIGFHPDRDFRYIEINQKLRALSPNVVAEVISGLDRAGGRTVHDTTTGILRVNEEFTLSIVIARCLHLPGGGFRWRVRFDTCLTPDVTIVVRMATNNTDAFDYYLFPRIDLPLHALRLSEDNNEICLDAYRFESLKPLFALAERVALKPAA